MLDKWVSFEGGVYQGQEIRRLFVEYDGRPYFLPHIHQRFEHSELGAHQTTQQPRFHKIYPLGENYDEHIQLLGDDAHPVLHMVYTTRELTLPFIEAHQQINSYDPKSRLAANEVAALAIASVIHDIDECEHDSIENAVGYTIGDIPSFLVTPEDEAKKLQIRRDFLYPRLYPDFPDDLIEEIESVIRHDDTKIGRAFSALEILGYFKTALKAAQLADQLSTSHEDHTNWPPEKALLRKKLIELAGGVAMRNFKSLREKSSEFPALERMAADYFSQFQRLEHRIGIAVLSNSRPALQP